MNAYKMQTTLSKDEDNIYTLGHKAIELHDLMVDVAKSVRDLAWIDDRDLVEEIEFKSRDGFIAYGDNRGGFTVRGLTDVSGLMGSGEHMRFNESAYNEIERQHEVNFQYAVDAMIGRYPVLKTFKREKINYHDLIELEMDSIAEELDEYTRCDESTIMLEVRVMYHGDNKYSVSAVVNTEGPYHRSHISWAPHIKCEHGKEVECDYRGIKSAIKKLMLSELGLKL